MDIEEILDGTLLGGRQVVMYAVVDGQCVAAIATRASNAIKMFLFMSIRFIDYSAAKPPPVYQFFTIIVVILIIIYDHFSFLFFHFFPMADFTKPDFIKQAKDVEPRWNRSQQLSLNL